MKTLLLLGTLGSAAVAVADGLPTTPYIYVQGAAEERIAPDLAIVSFQLSSVDRDQARAKAMVSDKSAAVFKLLGQLAIGDDAIVAPALSVNESYDFNSGKREFNGYVVKRDFTVRLKDLALYPKLANGLIELRVEALSDAVPGSSQAAERAPALKKAALAQARQQAEEIAAGMNARVTGVFAVSPIAFGEIPQTIFGSGGGRPVALAAYSTRADKGGPGDRYIFDQLTLTERLHVIFLIEPGAK
jgi:uncharacterized protein